MEQYSVIFLWSFGLVRKSRMVMKWKSIYAAAEQRGIYIISAFAQPNHFNDVPHYQISDWEKALSFRQKTRLLSRTPFGDI